MRRLVDFYVTAHNSEIPHSAFRGQTPDEMYFDRGHGIAEHLEEAKKRAPGRTAAGQPGIFVRGLRATGTDERRNLGSGIAGRPVGLSSCARESPWADSPVFTGQSDRFLRETTTLAGVKATRTGHIRSNEGQPSQPLLVSSSPKGLLTPGPSPEPDKEISTIRLHR